MVDNDDRSTIMARKTAAVTVTPNEHDMCTVVKQRKSTCVTSMTTLKGMHLRARACVCENDEDDDDGKRDEMRPKTILHILHLRDVSLAPVCRSVDTHLYYTTPFGKEQCSELYSVRSGRPDDDYLHKTADLVSRASSF